MSTKNQKKIKEMTTEELREYKRQKANQYNNKPKKKCDICGRDFKPCSEQAHLKSAFHVHTVNLKEIQTMLLSQIENQKENIIRDIIDKIR